MKKLFFVLCFLLALLATGQNPKIPLVELVENREGKIYFLGPEEINDSSLTRKVIFTSEKQDNLSFIDWNILARGEKVEQKTPEYKFFPDAKLWWFLVPKNKTTKKVFYINFEKRTLVAEVKKGEENRVGRQFFIYLFNLLLIAIAVSLAIQIIKDQEKLINRDKIWPEELRIQSLWKSEKDFADTKKAYIWLTIFVFLVALLGIINGFTIIAWLIATAFSFCARRVYKKVKNMKK